MRPRLLGLVLFAALLASSACSIDATAPASLAAPAAVTASRQQGAEQDDQGSERGAGAHYSIRIDPTRRNLLHFGPHTLLLPASSVCSAEDSGYGLGIFDEECTPETRPVTIVATVSKDPRGHPRIDLKPEMRFSPDRTVVLSLYVGRADIQSLSSWRILYCPFAGFQGCVDESLSDPSLTAHADIEAGIVYRRLKHFSGYWYAD
jgi:hypothetical protein